MPMCPLQVMLRQDSGEYACIAEDVVRYNLGELKEELQAAMGLATEEEGSAMQVRRQCYCVYFLHQHHSDHPTKPCFILDK
jgi:hypothetical protein